MTFIRYCAFGCIIILNIKKTFQHKFKMIKNDILYIKTNNWFHAMNISYLVTCNKIHNFLSIMAHPISLYLYRLPAWRKVRIEPLKPIILILLIYDIRYYMILIVCLKESTWSTWKYMESIWCMIYDNISQICPWFQRIII